jgi:3D (Asp-Asp-Asp) domain-containing protein
VEVALFRFENERKLRLIGRVMYAVFLVSLFAIYPVSAATTSAQSQSPSLLGSVNYDHGTVVWERLERRTLKSRTITRYSTALRPGRSKVVSHGRPGLVELIVSYSQRDGGPVRRHVLSRTVVVVPKPRIVLEGGDAALAMIHLDSVMRHVMHMVATAYTAATSGGSGWTAIGRRAGYGIVAVDPRVIPLGTRLYIPGYGMAIAGDTGGAIVGLRIDLGFDSYRSAIDFGRRDVTVYQLK